MTDATQADIDTLLAGDVSLATYATLRDAALSNEGNAHHLQDLADRLDPRSSAQAAVKKGLSLLILGRSSAAIRALETAHPKEELASVFLGRAYLESGEAALAEARFREALAKHPESRPIAYGLVLSVLHQNKVDEAAQILDRAEKHFGQDDEIRFLRGFQQELSGEYYEAKEVYEQVLARKPDHAHALFRLAFYHQTWGEEATAIELYERLRALRPTYAAALMNLGNLYEDQQKYDLAIDCYEEILEAVPNHSRAMQYLDDARSSKTMFYDEEGERRADRQSAILKIPVTDFELSVRSRNCLNKMNIRTLGDLVQMTEEELLAHKNFGETSLMEVKQMLAQKGLRLGQGKIEGRVIPAPRPVEASPELLSQDIGELDLSVRSRKCMERLGISTIGALVSRTEAELLSAKNFGQTSLNEIKQRLEERGLRLKDAPY